MKFIVTWILPAIIIFSVILDAFRDRWLPKRCRNEAWLAWHLIKWGSFFSPLILLSYLWLDYHNFQISHIFYFWFFMLFCGFIWRLIYNFRK